MKDSRPTDSSAASFHTTARRVTSNAFSNVLVVLLEMGVGFLLLPMMVKSFGPSTNGVWELIGSVFGYSLLLQFGINSAVNYHMPRLLIDKDFDRINRIVSTGAVFYTAMAGVVLAATIVLAVYFPRWFGSIEAKDAETSQILACIVGAYFTLTLPLSIYQGVLSGLQTYGVMNFVRIGTRLARAVLIIAALTWGGSLITVGLLHATTRLVESAALPVLAKRRLPSLRVRFALADFPTFRAMLEYSVNSMIFASSDALFKTAGILVIGIFLTAADATYYAAMMTIITALSSMAQSIAAVAKPAATALLAEGRTDKIQELSLRGSRYVVLALLPVVTMLCAYGSAFLGAWVGPDFQPLGGILALLVVTEFFTVGQRVSALVLIGLGKHRTFAVLTIVAALCEVIVALILVQAFSFGLWGVAIGHAISNGVIGIIFLPYYASRALGVSTSRHLKEIFLRPLVGSLPFFLLVAVIRYAYTPVHLWSIFLLSGGCGVAALTCYWFLVLDDEERMRVIRPLRRRWSVRS